eukprot:365704-Chlamydomonas_euryale.AAC.5
MLRVAVHADSFATLNALAMEADADVDASVERHGMLVFRCVSVSLYMLACRCDSIEFAFGIISNGRRARSACGIRLGDMVMSVGG